MLNTSEVPKNSIHIWIKRNPLPSRRRDEAIHSEIPMSNGGFSEMLIFQIPSSLIARLGSSSDLILSTMLILHFKHFHFLQKFSSLCEFWSGQIFNQCPLPPSNQWSLHQFTIFVSNKFPISYFLSYQIYFYRTQVWFLPCLVRPSVTKSLLWDLTEVTLACQN